MLPNPNLEAWTNSRNSQSSKRTLPRSTSLCSSNTNTSSNQGSRCQPVAWLLYLRVLCLRGPERPSGCHSFLFRKWRGCPGGGIPTPSGNGTSNTAELKTVRSDSRHTPRESLEMIRPNLLSSIASWIHLIQLSRARHWLAFDSFSTSWVMAPQVNGAIPGLVFSLSLLKLILVLGTPAS